MTKTYISSTEVSFNVRVGDGWQHVSFVPLTLGGSYLTTSDTGLQEAIEQHRFFGSLVLLKKEEHDSPAVTVAHQPSGSLAASGSLSSSEASAVSVSPQSPSPTISRNTSPRPLVFGSLADAKEWIASEYGISRTLLRTRGQMETVALEHGRILTIETLHPSNSS